VAGEVIPNRLLTFRPVTQYKAGIIASLLHQCYAKIVSAEPLYWQTEEANWSQFDREVFENPDTVGRCVFITCLAEEVIGFGSFDPRQRPELGIIGHNCILPQFQGHGYGKRQIQEILERFNQMGIKRVQVITGEHPFFLPAQKMYLDCGFHEKSRLAGGPDPRHKVIEYEMGLK
jgi:GNAT superfamily N-acetyltransferase